VHSYPSDLTDDQWRYISKFVPKAKHGGRPRSTDERAVVNAILYLVRTSCQWRQLPSNFPPWQTVYRYFARMSRSGVVRAIHRALYVDVRALHDRKPSPSAVVIDSQSVKTGKAGGTRGFDGGKRVKGRKRHIVVDTLGLLVDVAVTPANVHDTVGGRKALTKAKRWLSGKPKTIFADRGYQGSKFWWWARLYMGAHVQVSENPAMKTKQFVPVKKRWVVERTFGWFSNYRRLDKDQERLMVHSTTMIRWAFVALMLNRLAPR
jgi:putative transposase